MTRDTLELIEPASAKKTKNIFGGTLTVRALENKMYACMMLFFICNAVESQLVSTGAFEISVDNMPVW